MSDNADKLEEMATATAQLKASAGQYERDLSLYTETFSILPANFDPDSEEEVVDAITKDDKQPIEMQSVEMQRSAQMLLGHVKPLKTFRDFANRPNLIVHKMPSGHYYMLFREVTHGRIFVPNAVMEEARAAGDLTFTKEFKRVVPSRDSVQLLGKAVHSYATKIIEYYEKPCGRPIKYEYPVTARPPKAPKNTYIDFTLEQPEPVATGLRMAVSYYEEAFSELGPDDHVVALQRSINNCRIHLTHLETRYPPAPCDLELGYDDEGQDDDNEEAAEAGALSEAYDREQGRSQVTRGHGFTASTSETGSSAASTSATGSATASTSSTTRPTKQKIKKQLKKFTVPCSALRDREY